MRAAAVEVVVVKSMLPGPLPAGGHCGAVLCPLDRQRRSPSVPSAAEQFARHLGHLGARLRTAFQHVSRPSFKLNSLIAGEDVILIPCQVFATETP